MSSGSNSPSSANNRSPSRVSECPSIRQVISSLRSAFREEDFFQAEAELLSREANLRREMEEIELNLREKYDILEGEHKDLRLKVLELEVERDLLTRECEVSDDKLAVLATDLKAAESGVERANRRYGESLKKLETMGREKEEFLDKLHREQSEYTEKLASLRNEVDDLRRKLRQKEDKINELMRKNGELLGIEKREAEAMAQLEELRRRNGHLQKIVNEKDEMIKELVKKNENLETEKTEALKQIEDLRVEKREEELSIDEMKERVSKMETSVTSWMCNAPRDKKLANSQVEKVLSTFIKFMDSKETGIFPIKDGNFLDADPVVASHPNEPAEIARALIFGPEVATEAGSEKAVRPVIDIIEIESESDDETLNQHELKRKLSRREDNEVSSDDSLNPKHKVKKLNDLTHEPVKRELITPRRQTVSAVRKCNEKLREEGNIQDNSRSAEANTVFSPKVKELVNTCRRMTGNNMVVKRGV